MRELIGRRVPLYRFVLTNVLSKYDLDRADTRIDALREAARLVISIRDRSKVDAFTRELAGQLGMTSTRSAPRCIGRHPGRRPRPRHPVIARRSSYRPRLRRRAWTSRRRGTSGS